MLFKTVANAFYKLATETRDVFRARAFRHSADLLNKSPNTIVSVKTLSEVLSKRMIVHALNVKPISISYYNLMSIPGIGMAKAKQLIAAGVKNMADLKLKKYNDLLGMQSRLFIKLKPVKIDRKYVSMLERLLTNVIFTGSYRRNKQIVGDIDIVTSDLLLVVDMLKSLGKCYIYSSGNSKVSMYFDMSNIVKKPMICIVDIFAASDIVPMVLYTTGSADNNTLMRHKAKLLGYKLNQYGLFQGKKRIALKTEASYYEILGLAYKHPAER